MYLLYLNKDNVVTGYTEVYNTDLVEGNIPGTDSYILIKDSLPDHWENAYYKAGIFKQLPPRTDFYLVSNLELEQWVEPEGYLQTIRADGSKQINQLASQKILSKYPIYRQLNIGRTSEAQVMYDWIDNIRDLSNIATANITQAVTQEEITAIADNFKTELGNIA